VLGDVNFGVYIGGEACAHQVGGVRMATTWSQCWPVKVMAQASLWDDDPDRGGKKKKNTKIVA